MKRYKIFTILIFSVSILLSLILSGCGMSEGQNVNMFVSQMKVYERRVEDDAYEMNKIVNDVSAPLTAEQRSKIVGALTAQKGSFEETLEAVSKASRAPEQCAEIKKIYEDAFTQRIEHCKLLIDFVQRECADGKTPSPEAVERLKSENEKILAKTASIEEDLIKAKTRLANQYREVQIPEVQGK